VSSPPAPPLLLSSPLAVSARRCYPPHPLARAALHGLGSTSPSAAPRRRRSTAAREPELAQPTLPRPSRTVARQNDRVGVAVVGGAAADDGRTSPTTVRRVDHAIEANPLVGHRRPPVRPSEVMSLSVSAHPGVRHDPGVRRPPSRELEHHADRPAKSPLSPN